MMGNHMIKSWSVTQSVISLSSGEAEYYSLVKGASMGLGVQGICSDLGVRLKLKVKTDASAAKGIAHRRGTGKVKHIELNQLWLQNKVACGEIDINKVGTKENLADALTKYVTADDLQYQMNGAGQIIEEGRHEIMPRTEVFQNPEEPNPEI